MSVPPFRVSRRRTESPSSSSPHLPRLQFQLHQLAQRAHRTQRAAETYRRSSVSYGNCVRAAHAGVGYTYPCEVVNLESLKSQGSIARAREWRVLLGRAASCMSLKSLMNLGDSKVGVYEREIVQKPRDKSLKHEQRRPGEVKALTCQAGGGAAATRHSHLGRCSYARR